MVYLGVAHRWESFTSGKIMYPAGGIGALPDAIADSIRSRGGKVFHSMEATAIRQVASGYQVDCADGRIFAAGKVIIAAPMPWAVFNLFRGDGRFDALRAAIRRRKAFPACFMSFVALDPTFDFGGANVLVDWADSGRAPSLWQARKAGCDLNASTAPLSCVVAGAGRAKDGPIALTVAATLGWDFAATWGSAGQTDATKGKEWLGAPASYQRSEAYQRVKAETEAVILSRLEARFGRGFRQAIQFSSSSTPLSFARYTNSPGGSYMGFSIGAGEYGRFLPQRSPIPGLLFAGQWVFPGFGIAGAAASGYYASKALLAAEGSDLDERLRAVES
jgi:phytoene dehydrogenase-like protein